MPSLSLRLPQKTCGLFDTGLAGSTPDAASYGVNAPDADTLSAADQFLLGALESGKVVNIGEPLHHPGVDSRPGLEKALAGQQEQTSADDAWDSLGDLETDQLGDDSLDAFIDLNQLLMGDTFLDEVPEVQPVTDMKAQTVEPVIHIPSPAGLDGADHQQFDLFDLLDSTTSEVNYSELLNPTPALSTLPDTYPPTATTITTRVSAAAEATTTSKGKGRKRKASTLPPAGPVKTSMFEIPGNVTIISPSSPVLDHDYMAKPLVHVATFACDNKNPFPEVIVAAAQSSTEADQTDQAPAGKVLDKQSIRRQKNNMASKRSREQRKQKFSDLDREAEELIVKNEALRHKIVELEKLAKDMKAALVAKMSGK